MNTGQYYFDKLPKDVQERFEQEFRKQDNGITFEQYLRLKFYSHNLFIGGQDCNYSGSLYFYWHGVDFGYWHRVSETKYP